MLLLLGMKEGEGGVFSKGQAAQHVRLPFDPFAVNLISKRASVKASG